MIIPSTMAKRYLRHALIRVGLEGISLARAGGMWRGIGGRGVIFTLHHVRPPERQISRASEGITITPGFLEDAILTCLEQGLTPLPLDELPERLADPRDRRAYVCFTLDDGYRNNVQFAAPVFRKHRIPYTIFVSQGFVDRTRPIWWETVAAIIKDQPSIEFDFGQGPEHLNATSKLQKSIIYDRFVSFIQTHDEDEAVSRIARLARDHGIDPIGLVDDLTLNAGELEKLQHDKLARIGAHSVTHVNLRRVSDARLMWELTESAKAVERHVGYRPHTFAFPYGTASAVGEREIAAAADAGFTVAVTNRPGLLDQDSIKQPTGLKRISLNGSYQRKRYVSALISGIPFKMVRARGSHAY
ncbi:polysaccharide deacetylase family protein [Chelativorans sp. Marseille-P2723]|uniref:polysaccharide deacetylase family protein n=1 Tax=Chelativorans sp. Marseille-P2723 TaxID=2709133 RepID=UPI001FEF3821|nr:polysaccharide deacetylase family protein [Chelativorans sp. Marseille-P2723]